MEDGLISAQKAAKKSEWKLLVEIAKYNFQTKKMTKSDACRESLKTMNCEESRLAKLRGRLDTALKPPTPSKRKTLLSPLQEDFVTSLATAFSVTSNALSKQDLRIIARAAGNLPEIPSTGWVQSFGKRHKKNINFREGRKSHKKVILSGVLQNVGEWTKETGNILKGLALDDSLVFNIDETRALPRFEAKAMVSSSLSAENQYQCNPENTLYTLVTCISADGSVLFCLYIWKQTEKKKSLNQSLYVPEIVEKRKIRSIDSYPTYFALAPSGYMNGELWQETMKIFVDLVSERQGLGRLKQAVLFLDGCASHLKEFTHAELVKKNIFSIYFPSNTSHVLQPLDGQPFALYKSSVGRSAQKLAFKASLGTTSEKTDALAVCIECHGKAVTKKIVKGAFVGRGIWPWDPIKAIANATRACPTVGYIEAHTQLETIDMAFRVVDAIKQSIIEAIPTQHIALQVMNSPVKTSELSPHKKRAKRTSATVPPPKKVPKVLSSDEKSDLPLESDTEDGSDCRSEDSDPEPPKFMRAPSALICSHCGHPRSHGKVQVACTGCNKYWLCRTCEYKSDALSTHQETCEYCEGRALRKRKNPSISSFRASNGTINPHSQ
jgi:cytochrome c553